MCGFTAVSKEYEAGRPRQFRPSLRSLTASEISRASLSECAASKNLLEMSERFIGAVSVFLLRLVRSPPFWDLLSSRLPVFILRIPVDHSHRTLGRSC